MSKQIHYTADGGSILIAAMDDQHLLNTIALFCRKMENVRSAVDQQGTASAFERALYGFDTVSAEDAASMIRQGIETVAPYVFEAALRGLDVRADLQAAIGRAGQLGVITRQINGKTLVLP